MATVSASSCGSCYPGGESGGTVSVENQTDIAVVVEYRAGVATDADGDEVLRLDPHQRGSFEPRPAQDRCLLGPVVVLAETDGRVLAEAEAGDCFGSGLDLVVREP